MSAAVVAGLATMARAVPITITLAASPPVSPGDPYAITVILSAPEPVTNVAHVQLDYSLSSPGAVDVNSDECVAGSPLCSALPLEFNPPGSPVYARLTAQLPSSAVITPEGVAFITLNAVVPPGATTISVMGPSTTDNLNGAYIATADGTVWDNGLPGAEQVLGGQITLPPMDAFVLTAANPPMQSPFAPGQPFRDVLQTGAGASLTHGIGGVGTPDEGAISFGQISVTFSAAPHPAPTVSNVAITCTDLAANGPADCPAVANVAGNGSGPYVITLTGAIPPRECTSLMFAGAQPGGQKLQYQSLPGDVTLNGIANTLDLLGLIQALNDGSANEPANWARYNVDRSTQAAGRVNTQDLLRLVQLLNGVRTTQPFNGATAAPCP